MNNAKPKHGAEASGLNPGFTAVAVLTLALGIGVRVLDCGGKRSATPLSHARHSLQEGDSFERRDHFKGVSPLRSVTAVQDAAAPPYAWQPLPTDY